MQEKDGIGMGRKTDIAERESFAYQRELGMHDSVSDEHIVARRLGFYDGYRKAERDIMKRLNEEIERLDADRVAKDDESYDIDSYETGCINGIKMAMNFIKSM